MPMIQHSIYWEQKVVAEGFRDAGILFPDSFENLSTKMNCKCLNDLKGQHPDMRRAVVKLNEVLWRGQCVVLF